MNQSIFASDQHRAFYKKCLARTREDSYHRALFYLLGACGDTRRQIGRLFDFEEDCIRPESLHAGWQTDGSYRLCLLAFNLWNGYTGADHDLNATPEELFCCGYAPFMMEGIRLRYPEYCREIEMPRISTAKPEAGRER